MLIATFGVIVPSAAAATGDPKVVIIVGATHGATAGYRADADRAYAEAIKYTPNVVKVYSPNATWAKVKAAVVGASIVIYLGHGNGWPSPYTYDAKYTTKDGFGLNATAGAGDYNNKYYGEPYVSTLDLAPNAVVILNHLCYASGNSEPGNPEPTVTVARQRADNYAAGFLKAGASAVIADGHAGSEVYIRATVHDPSVGRGHVADRCPVGTATWSASRPRGRPATTVYQDPITPTTGFYRSLAVQTLGVTTDEVVSGGYGDTGVNPTSLVVPGNAAVSTDGAGVYGDLDSTGVPTTTLPAGTRLHVVEQPTQPSDAGGTLVEVAGIDDPSIAGYMLASDLAAARQHRPGRPRPRPRRRVLAQRRRTARRRVAARPVHRIGRLDAEDPRRRRPRAVLDDRDRLHVPGRLGRQGRGRSRRGWHLPGERQRRRRRGATARPGPPAS